MGPGQVIAGQYELQRLLGSGGCGQVWLATEVSTGERFALKVMHKHSSAKTRHSFEQEIWTMGRLSHGSIVAAINEGLDERAGRFFVMEHVEGTPLSVGGMVLDRMLELFDKLLSALSYIHARDLVHLDLKPDNVLIPSNPPPRIKLLDFGISHMGEDFAYGLDVKPIRLGEGVLVGTAAYMSPEQASGEPHSVGPASDIYTVGVMLFEALTGKLPYSGGVLNMIYQHLCVEAPSLGLPASLHPLEALILQMLKKGYHERPQCAADVRRALREIRSSCPTGEMVLPKIDEKISDETIVRTMIETWDKHHPQTKGAQAERETRRNWRLSMVRSLPLVGRKPEREALLSAIKKVERGQPESFVITGPRGSGKRQLSRWLVEMASEEGTARVLKIDLSSRPDLSSAIKLGLYRYLRLPRLEPGPLKQRVQEVFAFDDSETQEACVSFLYSGGDTLPPDKLWELWRLTFEKIIQKPDRRMLFLWINGEDRAEEVSPWIESLMAAAKAAQWPLLVMWSRPSSIGLDTAPQSPGQKIELGPLSRRSQLELIELLEPSLMESPRKALVDACLGNPLFIKESLMRWRDKNLLVETPAGLDLRQTKNIEIANDLEEALTSRLDEMLSAEESPEGLSTALKTMAFFGNTLTGEQVEDLLCATSWSLSALITHHWMVPERVGREEEFAFSTPLIRQIMLSRIKDEERESLVKACVEMRLLGSLRAMVTSDWESARHHIKAGLRLVDAKGAEDAGAMRLWLNDAMARTAYRQRDAERLAGIAGGLEHLSGDLEGADLVDCRAAARLWLGCSHLLEGDQEESRRAFEAVASVEGSSFQGLAWHFLSEVAQSHRKLDLAQTSLAKALAFFKDRTWHSGYQRKLFRLAEADVKRNMGHFFASLNQADEQRRYIEEALETFVQEGDMQGEARALAELIRMLRLRLEAQALPDTELLAEAQRVWNKLDHIMSLLDDRRGHALKDWEAASLAMVDGELDLAETFYKRAGEHFLACGDKLGHGLALNAQAEMSRRRGHLSDAHALTERFVSLMEDIPNDHIRALALNNLGWIEIEIGHLEMAPQRFERALSLVGESGPALDRASMLVGSAELLVIGGDLEEALPTLAAARATCPDAPVLDTAIGDSLNRIATSLASNGQGAATSICALVGGWLAAAPAS